MWYFHVFVACDHGERLTNDEQQGLLLQVSFNMKGLLKKFLFDHKLGNQGLAHGKIS